MNLICTKCKTEKDSSCFSKNQKKKGFCSWCKECFRAYDKLRRQNPEFNAKKNRTQNLRYDKIRQFVWDYLKINPCIDCGEPDPVVLEFDHRNEKITSISQMLTRGFSIEKLKIEIEKCDVRCANCHRRKTAIQLNWYQGVVR